MHIALSAAFVSAVLTVALCIGLIGLAFPFLVIGVARWRGIDCDPWPVLGPVLFGTGMMLVGGGIWRINYLVATGFGLVALASLIRATVVARRIVIEERALAAEARANPKPKSKTEGTSINRRPSPPVRKVVER